MSGIPRPNFIERTPSVIEPEVKTAFETALGKTLFPGQLEQLLLNVAVYRELLIRVGVQSAAEQNLVNYATGINLDQLGQLLAVDRLAAKSATVSLQFSRASTNGELVIPAGASVRQAGSQISFETDEDATIIDGLNTVVVSATATTAGATGNGFATGTITQLVNAPAEVVSVTNTAASAGGSGLETDAAFRTRIKLAPNQFSVAGSKGAYKFHALSVDPSIIDVAVLGPEDRNGADPVTVDVYPLTSSGLPSTEILDGVTDALNLDTIRPLTDIVNVAAPTLVQYDITADVVVYDDVEEATVEASLLAAAANYAETQSSGLGLDIVRSQIIQALQAVPGVYSIALTAPAANIEIGLSEWASLDTLTITVTETNAG